GVLLQSRRIRKMVSSYVGENAEFERQFLSGELEVDLVPQGTLAERMRGGGECILEEGVVGDFSLVAAWRGDRLGNLVYRRSARNFNPMAATCGRVCVAEVEELVEPGELDPDSVHTPGLYVDRI